MSTPSPEKDTLFGPTVHEKIAYQILKWEVFFGTPFTTDSQGREVLRAMIENRVNFECT